MPGSVDRLISGRSVPKQAASVGGQAAEGVVHAVLADGIVFKLPGFDGGVAFFGPAPWQKPVVVNPLGGTFIPVTPSPGDRVLVVFTEPFPNGPWVAAWWPA